MLCHTNMSYEEICERTILQIEAVMARLGQHIGLKIGVPMAAEEKPAEPVEEHTVDDALAFCSLFNGLA